MKENVRNILKILVFILTSIEICILAVYTIFFSYSSFGGDSKSAFGYIKYYWVLQSVPYETLLAVGKGKKPLDTLPQDFFKRRLEQPTEKDVLFAALVRHSKVQMGLHCLLLVLVLCIVIASGFNSFLLGLITVVLLLIGITKLAVGTVEVI